MKAWRRLAAWWERRRRDACDGFPFWGFTDPAIGVLAADEDDER